MNSFGIFCSFCIASQNIQLHSKEAIPGNEDCHKRKNLNDNLANQLSLKPKIIINLNDVQVLQNHECENHDAQNGANIFNAILAKYKSGWISRN